MQIEEIAQQSLDQLLKSHHLPKKNHYSSDEVEKILDISRTSLNRRFLLYEKPVTGKKSTVPPLKSKKIAGHRYVNYWDLVEYLAKGTSMELLSEIGDRSSQKNAVKNIYPGALPCPYCKGVRVSPGSRDDGLVVLFCHDCLASGPCAGTFGEALILWNKRG